MSTPPPSQNLFDELQNRFAELLRAGPAGDLERNIRAILSQTFQKLDLVTREEFDIQVALVDGLRSRLVELERAVRKLEGSAGDESDRV